MLGDPPLSPLQSPILSSNLILQPYILISLHPFLFSFLFSFFFHDIFFSSLFFFFSFFRPQWYYYDSKMSMQSPSERDLELDSSLYECLKTHHFFESVDESRNRYLHIPLLPSSKRHFSSSSSSPGFTPPLSPLVSGRKFSGC